MNNLINDNRGFMMAELIIVASIIITTLVTLYASFSKMYTAYSERSYYLDVDGKYILKTIYDDLINSNNFVSLVNNDDGLNEASDVPNRYINIIRENNCQNSILSSDLCSILKNNFEVQTVIFSRYNDNIFTNVNNSNDLDNLLSADYNEGFKQYFRYLNGYLDFNDDYSYIFMIEYKIGNDTYYSNYLVR